MKWEMVNLGEYTKVKTGKLDANASSEDGQYPFFTCSQTALKIDSYSYNCECVLVAGNGDLNVKYYNGKFDAYQRTYIVESTNKNILNVRYLYYFLDKYIEKLRDLSIGGVIKYIKLGNLTEVLIPLPTIEIQYKIAEALDKAQELVDKRKKQIELLDQFVKSTFIEIFGDPVTNPKEWKTYTVRDAANVISDGPFGSNLKSEHYSENGIRIIRLQNIGCGELVDEDKAFVPNSHYQTIKKHTCLAGDVIIGTMGNPNLRACILPKEIGIAINKADCIQFRANDKITNAYYICWLLNMPQTLVMASNLLHGQTRVRVSMGQLSQMNIPIPPLNLQNQFAEVMIKAEKQKAMLTSGLERLERNYKSLMQKAFNGELFQ